MATVGGMRNLRPLAGPRPAGSGWVGHGTEVLPLTDNLGTVRDLAVYNAAAGVTSVANHRIYTAFGQLVSQTNPSNPSAAAVDCIFGFTGRPFDPATGLQNNLNRWYDPATGNWLSQDPTGFSAGDTNLYRYCGNSPANARDPSGTTWNPFNPEFWTFLFPFARPGARPRPRCRPCRQPSAQRPRRPQTRCDGNLGARC